MINDNTYMQIAKIFSKESKCVAKKVACIIVKDDNIISIGINGTPPGKTNCNELYTKHKGILYSLEGDTFYPCEDQEEHHKWSLFNEYHAELNALGKANKNSLNVSGSTAYITHSPCFNCSKMLVNFGINKIVFEQKYDDFEEGVLSFLKENNVSVYQINDGIISIL